MKQLTATRLGSGLTLATLIFVASLGVAVAQGGNRTGDLHGSPGEQEEIQEAAPAAGSYDLFWWTVDGGGTTPNDSSGYTLGGTAGQPDAAVWTGDGYTLAGGFWGGEAGKYRIYLPLLRKG